MDSISLACHVDPTLKDSLIALRIFRESGPVLLENPIFL